MVKSMVNKTQLRKKRSQSSFIKHFIYNLFIKIILSFLLYHLIILLKEYFENLNDSSINEEIKEQNRILILIYSYYILLISFINYSFLL
jgi:hypothetical protein